MSDRYRIIHYKAIFAIQRFIPKYTSYSRKYFLFGSKIEHITEEHWSTLGELTGVSPDCIFEAYEFPTVQDAENYIKGLRSEVVKEVNYEQETTSSTLS